MLSVDDWTWPPRFYLLHGAIDAPLPEHARQLFMVPEFRKGVLDFRDSETPSEDGLMWQLQNMFSHLQVCYCTVGVKESSLVASRYVVIGVNGPSLVASRYGMMRMRSMTSGLATSR